MNAANTSNTATICMKLMAENFEEFYCKQNKKIGISMKSLYNHIKNMADDETLTFYYENILEEFNLINSITKTHCILILKTVQIQHIEAFQLLPVHILKYRFR